jgi:hypothetical protein
MFEHGSHGVRTSAAGLRDQAFWLALLFIYLFILSYGMEPVG